MWNRQIKRNLKWNKFRKLYCLHCIILWKTYVIITLNNNSKCIKKTKEGIKMIKIERIVLLIAVVKEISLGKDVI